MRLILGCGNNKHQKQEGDYFVDQFPFDGVDLVFNLNKQNWKPIAPDKSVDSIIANHLVEHLDSLINFMDNCWLLLKPGGSLYLETPLAGVNPDLEFADPTHVRCYRIHTFANYFSPEGVKNFGYTDKPWNFFVLRVQNDCIQVHAYPIKL